MRYLILALLFLGGCTANDSLVRCAKRCDMQGYFCNGMDLDKGDFVFVCAKRNTLTEARSLDANKK